MVYGNIAVLLALVVIMQVRAELVELTDEDRMLALDAHNAFRSEVALGNAVNKNGTTLPMAGNMYKLSWSRMVEGYAQELADTCNSDHTYVNGTSNNLNTKMSNYQYFSAPLVLNGSVFTWYKELASRGQSSLTMDGTNYNHFTQVVWAETKEIGCAVAHCPSMTGLTTTTVYKYYTFVVCDYSRSGNVRTRKIYNPSSEPADSCPEGSTGDQDTGLCQVDNVEDIHD